MISEQMVEALNKQLNKEFYSAYLYLNISNYFYNQDLNGYGNYFTVSAQEEEAHASLIRDYLIYQGAMVELEAIQKPAVNLSDVKQILELVVAHERGITKSIYEIYTLAEAEKDYATRQYLDWFVKEQVEEESQAEAMVKRYELFGKEGKGLMQLDNELKAAVFTAPAKLVTID